MKKKNKYDGMILTGQDMTRQQLLNKALVLTLEFSRSAIAIALQEKEGGPVLSYYMNKEAMEIMVLGIYFIENNNIQKSMELVAANMKNADEWLDFTRKNFMSRERAELVIHMQDGARYIWDSRALRGSGRENYGRIVLIRKV